MGFLDGIVNNFAGKTGNVQGAAEALQQLENTDIQLLSGGGIKEFAVFATYVKEDFAGISMSGLNQLTTDVQKIIDDVENVMTSFGAKQNEWDEGLQGKAQADAIAYVETVKQLLIAYVTSLKNLLGVANEAAHSLAEADVQNQAAIQQTNQDLQQISQSIETEANNAANQIDVDGLGY